MAETLLSSPAAQDVWPVCPLKIPSIKGESAGRRTLAEVLIVSSIKGERLSPRASLALNGGALSFTHAMADDLRKSVHGFRWPV